MDNTNIIIDHRVKKRVINKIKHILSDLANNKVKIVNKTYKVNSRIKNHIIRFNGKKKNNMIKDLTNNVTKPIDIDLKLEYINYVTFKLINAIILLDNLQQKIFTYLRIIILKNYQFIKSIIYLSLFIKKLSFKFKCIINDLINIEIFISRSHDIKINLLKLCYTLKHIFFNKRADKYKLNYVYYLINHIDYVVSIFRELNFIKVYQAFAFIKTVSKINSSTEIINKIHSRINRSILFNDLILVFMPIHCQRYKNFKKIIILLHNNCLVKNIKN